MARLKALREGKSLDEVRSLAKRRVQPRTNQSSGTTGIIDGDADTPGSTNVRAAALVSVRSRRLQRADTPTQADARAPPTTSNPWK